MILGFKPQFVEPILKGTKKHTIRIDKNNRWKPGRQIQFATGVRTKKYNCFREGWCRSTQSVEIGYRDTIPYITVDGKDLNIDEIEILALNDGFSSSFYLFQWFVTYSYTTSFLGKIIHWTDFKY
jgi:hypothetical protein